MPSDLAELLIDNVGGVVIREAVARFWLLDGVPRAVIPVRADIRAMSRLTSESAAVTNSMGVGGVPVPFSGGPKPRSESTPDTMPAGRAVAAADVTAA